jgi:hypothetical protein
MRFTKSATRRAGGVGLVLALSVPLAACGSSTGPGVASIGPTTTTTTVPAGGTASPAPFASPTKEYGYALSYAECMRSHGVTGFPLPVKSNRGFSFNSTADSHSPHFHSANAVCKHLLPDNGGPASAAQLAAEKTRMLKYARCMRSHGEPRFPDPTVSTKFVGFQLNGLDPNSSRFMAAQNACRSAGASAGF